MIVAKFRTWLTAALVSLMGFGAMAVQAANVDAGLYAAAPPPNSVFIRLVSATADGKPIDATIGKLRYVTPSGTASVYKVMPAGNQVIKVGAASKALALVDGRYYTVVVSGTQAKPNANLIEDPKLDSKIKGLITFYNLTGRASLTLKTADGKAAVVPAVGPGHVGSRSVNGASTGFAVFDGATSVGTIPVQTIERGNAYSSIVTEAGGKVKVVWIRSETGH